MTSPDYVTARECDSRFEAVLRHLSTIERQMLVLSEEVKKLSEFRWKLAGAALLASSLMAFLVSIIF